MKWHLSTLADLLSVLTRLYGYLETQPLHSRLSRLCLYLIMCPQARFHFSAEKPDKVFTRHSSLVSIAVVQR